jgi:transposase
MGYKKYSDELKREVLGMVAVGNRSIAQIERDLDISPGLIYKWQQRYQVKGDALQPSEERGEQAELRRLRRELEIVKQERDILKKAIQVFSRGES